MLEGRVSRRELKAEKEGCASVNNESIDPPADDGSGCYDDRCNVAQRVEKRFVSQNRGSESGSWILQVEEARCARPLILSHCDH